MVRFRSHTHHTHSLTHTHTHTHTHAHTRAHTHTHHTRTRTGRRHVAVWCNSQTRGHGALHSRSPPSHEEPVDRPWGTALFQTIQRVPTQRLGTIVSVCVCHMTSVQSTQCWVWMSHDLLYILIASVTVVDSS